MKKSSVAAAILACSGLWFLLWAGIQPRPAVAVFAGVCFLIGAFLVVTPAKGKGR